ncbi:hypothetical protein BOG92_009715 [Streptomyces sp. WAC00263]|nr:hypothetical protein BOG92_009715 [Streptomyces sp. WAC00263]
MASAQLVAMSMGGMIARAKDKAIAPAGHGATDRHLPKVRRPDRGTPRCHDTDPVIHINSLGPGSGAGCIRVSGSYEGYRGTCAPGAVLTGLGPLRG